MELYQQADKKKAKDKRDVALDDIELNKNPEEFTFQPNAHKYKKTEGGSPVAQRPSRLHEQTTRNAKRQGRERSEPDMQQKQLGASKQ